MFTFSTSKPYVRSIPKALQPFVKAGKVDDVFRPRVLGNGLFATPTGYGVSFSLGGIDSEGLDRNTLNGISKQIARANRVLPERCLVFEYLITAKSDDLPARVIAHPLVREQARERTDFLKANAKFKSVRLIVTLYLPGQVVDDAQDFSEKSRKALKQIQTAALLYEQQLRVAGIRRLLPDELVQIYSYLLNLDRSLMTRKAALPGEGPKKLGRVHIGLEGDYLRVGKQYCQVLSLVEPPRGTRPDLWGALLAVDCEMVWCSIWQRKAGKLARSKAAAVENAIGMAGGICGALQWAATLRTRQLRARLQQLRKKRASRTSEAFWWISMKASTTGITRCSGWFIRLTKNRLNRLCRVFRTSLVIQQKQGCSKRSAGQCQHMFPAFQGRTTTSVSSGCAVITKPICRSPTARLLAIRGRTISRMNTRLYTRPGRELRFSSRPS